jgi:signal transduction histidine kinase
VIDRQFVIRADSDPTATIGGRHYRAELDRLELARVFAGGAAASVTFEGAGGKIYKAGYAPIHASETEPEIVLALGVEAPAAYFDRLRDLRTSLLWWGAGLTAVVLAATFLAALIITRTGAPARDRGGADRRRRPDGAPVARASRDELGVLADTMDAMRRQLAERDAQMQQMLAGIAHEVRNPLAGIQLYAGILRDELAGDERAAHAAKIDREVGYLERVVRDFPRLRPAAAAELAPVELTALCREVAELAGAEAAAAGLEIDVDGAPLTAGGRRRAAAPRAAQPGQERGDRGGRGRRARRGGAAGGQPRRRPRDRRGVEPRADDRRRGVGADVRAVLHDPREGHRARAGVRRRDRPRPPRRGHGGVGARRDHVSCDAPGGLMAAILIIDDNDTIRDGLAHAVRKLGHETATAASGPAGLAAFRARPGGFDFVITDLKMDGLTASTCCASSRSSTPTAR